MNKKTEIILSERLCTSVPHTDNEILTKCKGNCNHSPVIILPGINHSPTYLYDNYNKPVLQDNKPIGGTLFIPNKNALNNKVRNQVLKKFISTLILQKNTGLDKLSYNIVSELLKYQKCDNQGTPINNLKTQRWNHSLDYFTEKELDWAYCMVPMEALVEKIGKDHVYFFTFNLVGDPMDSADDLNEYINLVKKQTGHDKVILLPISLGGTILTSYLDKYGHNSIEKIVNTVACLDGTDIFADIFAREWRLDKNYLYHDFLAKIFTEADGKPTKGYLINTLLHLVPRSGLNAVLSGAISGMIDTLIINAPQFWAMLPSYRYEELSKRYLYDKPFLRQRTDRFQQARLNLKQNLIKAHNNGVIINSIACANLDFGEQMYTYMNIVSSAERINSDGIVNLSSATLGATGAPGNKTLNDINYTKNEYCCQNSHNHVSVDNKVDASTAIFPENTWIFLNQHHEVEKNDVVLNLVKALILGEINSVNDMPEKYPQYNGTCNTRALHRWRVPDARKVDITRLSDTYKKELSEAIIQAENSLNATITNQNTVEAAENRLTTILHKIGAKGYENMIVKKKNPFDIPLEKAAYFLSKSSLFICGAGSPTDRILSPLRKKFKK